TVALQVRVVLPVHGDDTGDGRSDRQRPGGRGNDDRPRRAQGRGAAARSTPTGTQEVQPAATRRAGAVMPPGSSTNGKSALVGDRGHYWPRLPVGRDGETGRVQCRVSLTWQ